MHKARVEVALAAVEATSVLMLLLWGASALMLDDTPRTSSADEIQVRTQRNLVEEYGWDMHEPSAGGPLDHMKVAARAQKYNSILQTESARIQMELENSGQWFVSPIECDRLAARRLANQGIVPPDASDR